MLSSLALKIDERSIFRWISLLIVVLIISLTLVLPVMRIGFNFSIDYNEGWNVYHSIRAAANEVIYDNESNEWTPINYPPLSFYVVGNVGKLFGSPLRAGRYISLVSLLVISLIVGATVFRFGGERYDALFASFFCVGLFSIYATHYVGMNDPQMLGHVFQIVGLFFYVKRSKKKFNLFLVALFCSLGLYTKHNLITLPVAVILDLLLKDRKRFFEFNIYFAFIMISFLFAVYTFSGPDFVAQLLSMESSRGFSIAKVSYTITALGKNLQIPLICILPLVFFHLKKADFRIISLYTLVGLTTGSYFSGGSGVDINIFFDAFIGISINAGILLSYLRHGLGVYMKYPNLVYCVLPIILCFGMFMDARGKIVRRSTYSRFAEQERAFLEDAEFITEWPGPALCENILLCYYAGKEFQYDPFNVSELIAAQKMEESKVLSRLESGYFAIVQVNKEIEKRYLTSTSYGPVRSHGRLSENSQIALGKHYILCHKSKNGAFYLFRKLEGIPCGGG
jgi:hypothetical protein